MKNICLNEKNREYEELDRILSTQDISTVFQPIVSLCDGKIIGYECLSRGPISSSLYSPDLLFETAAKYNRLWDIELLCRVKAIERAGDIEKDKFLFINVDPHILKDEKFKQGFTKEFLAKHNMSPETIIFEITEKTSIEDYKTFKAALKNYVDQGYKIAIDDTGSGYSGLKMLSETKPHFVKIDMDLIRDIDKDFFKQALIKCFVSLAEVTGMKLIAEGIETKEELLTLIDLRVYAGQGYYLRRPADSFEDISEDIIELMVNYNKTKNNIYSFGISNYVGDIARKDEAFTFNTPCFELKEYFDRTCVSGACVTREGYPVGLLMKHTLDSSLATQYGVAVFLRRNISLVMDKKPLIVDYYSTVTEVSKAAMSRNNENLYDYVIVTKDNKYYGVVTIKNLLEYTTKLEYNYAKALNPLTALPGNLIIDSNLNEIINKDKELCLLYFDLDNFKIYNDIYGFESGDKIIRFTGLLIQNKVRTMFPYDNFIGHIGGDDFVSIVEGSIDKCNYFCKNIIEEFDSEILRFFNDTDRINGYIEAVDRKGNIDKFNLTSLSIAGLYKNFTNYSTVEKVVQEISRIKKQAKTINGSSFIITE
jgi:EAL domain-containing protein (putative c-di-GMP-specific phosphodiesterase class I)/GGDEF domain-containing protein